MMHHNVLKDAELSQGAGFLSSALVLRKANAIGKKLRFIRFALLREKTLPVLKVFSLTSNTMPMSYYYQVDMKNNQ